MRRSGTSRFGFCLLLFLCACFLPAQVDEVHKAEYRQELAQADRALQDRDYELAREHYERANVFAREHSVAALRGMAWANLRLEHPEKALENAQAALSLAANDTERGDLHNLTGPILFSGVVPDQKQTSKLLVSEAEFRSAIQMNPALSGAYFNLGTALLKDRKDAEGVKMLQKYLELTPDAANTSQVRRLIGDPRLSRGELAPNFTLQDTQGHAISTESLHGRVVLLDFWATWCGPCIASLPEIRKLARQFPADQFVLIGVNEDEDVDAWRKFMAKEDMPWPQSRDQNWDLFHNFGLAPERKLVVPAYVVLNGDGIVLQKIRGLEDASSLAAQIEAALEAAPGRR